MKGGQGPQDGSGRPRVPADGPPGQHQEDEGWARTGEDILISVYVVYICMHLCENM